MGQFSIRHAIMVCSIATLLAGCGGSQSQIGTSGAMPPTRAMAPLATREALPNLTDPCTRERILLGWEWKGSCIDKLLGQTTTTFNLKTYKGITTSLEFTNKEKSQAGSKILVGEGTGPSDIVGKVNGKTFPFYKSKGVKCYSWAGRGIYPCMGNVFLYVTINNLTDRTVVFTELPKSTIANKALPNGKVCFLVELFGATKEPIWEMWPAAAKVVNGKLTITDGLKAGGWDALQPLSGEILGYSCL